MLELFGGIKVDWIGKRQLFFAISIALLVVGMISLVQKGKFRYGVDFRGGLTMIVHFNEPVPPVDQIREALDRSGIKNSQIQEITDKSGDFQIEYGGSGDQGDLSNGREVVTKALNAEFGKGKSGAFDTENGIKSSEFVGPSVGGDLRKQAVTATLCALGGILVYIAFRFEWIYGAAAVFAVFHDTLVTLGIFSLFNKEINLTVIAALLTLVGYSVNDTIVVFDRVRENLKVRRRDDLESILNDSINQTLSRTILTSGLTFLTVLALYLFGGEIIRNFAFAMVIGIVVGTYSSIAVASPLVLIYTKFRGQGAKLAPATVKMPRTAKAR
jgi:preprotein translocase subunit SecF